VKRKYLRKLSKEDRARIDANTVTEVEIDPIKEYENGRYSGRLLSPDEQYPVPSNESERPRI